MLSYISGTVKHKTENSFIILVQGLGYEVFVNPKVLEKYGLNDTVEIFLYQNVREDALTLFGFEEHESLSLFKKLISISGVGPKSALNILEIASIDEIISSIQHSDPHLLTRVSGVGKKTAERVILELKNKLDSISVSSVKTDKGFSSSNDEVDALVALGYSEGDAREALRMVSEEVTNVSDRIKESLRYLSK